MTAQCETHSHQTGTRCIRDAGHDGRHQGMYYPADSAPRAWSWDDEDIVVNRESERKQGT